VDDGEQILRLPQAMATEAWSLAWSFISPNF
jgi:hypothetical protein